MSSELQSAGDRTLNRAELQDLFKFSEADLEANRQGHYSAGQHRLLGIGIALLLFAVLVAFSLPLQRELGRIFGWVGAPCLGVVDIGALLATFAGLSALWNTVRESRLTPVREYTGLVRLQRTGEMIALVSEAFSIPVEPEIADTFIDGRYRVFYVPKFVGDRDNLFSIEPADADNR